jgi:hypothetical protein
MAFTTNIPGVTFGATGFVSASSSTILAGVIADMQAAFGGGLNFTTTAGQVVNSTPQGQWSSSLTATIVNTQNNFCFISNMFDPAYATGRWQDAIGRIYFITRNPPLPTILNIACIGSQGVVISVGALIQDNIGYTYACTTGGTIPAAGTITLQFANTIVGPLPIPETNQVTIVQAIPGWDSVTCAGGTLGQAVEGRSAFELRRAQSVAGNSEGAMGSIIGAVSKVPGVLDYYGYDNGSASPITINGVTIPAHTIYVCAVGGTQSAVAQAILSKKGPGCAYYGNTTVTAYDSNPLYAAPVPYSVSFEIPPTLQILFAISIVAGPTVPSDAAAQIQAKIISTFAGSVIAVPRARINSLLLASWYSTAIQQLGAWVQVRALYMGSDNNPDCSFTGAISGNTLTVSAVASGALAIGQTISDGGVHIPEGVTIISGSGSSWVISASLTVGSEAMVAETPSRMSVQVQANQSPAVVAPNIVVVAS